MKDTYLNLKSKGDKEKDKALDKLIKQIDLKFSGVNKSVWDIKSEPESDSQTASAHNSDSDDCNAHHKHSHRSHSKNIALEWPTPILDPQEFPDKLLDQFNTEDE